MSRRWRNGSRWIITMGREPQPNCLGPSQNGLIRYYEALANLLQDQIASQLESASTNDIVSIGIVGAALAIVVALLLIRATNTIAGEWWWWWYPLPMFVVPVCTVGFPLLPRRSKRFQHGPSVPTAVQSFATSPQPLERMMERLLRDLHSSWRNNDALLAAEGRWITASMLTLAVATGVSVGLFAWRLS